MSERLIILAGGISSRMKRKDEEIKNVEAALIEDADKKTKSMIGVGTGNRPFLDYLLYNAREAGYSDIVIVIGAKDDSIKEYYGSNEINHFHGLEIRYAVQKIPEGFVKPIGTADALWQGLLTRSDWKGKKFTVCNSDNLYSIDVLKKLALDEFPNALIDYDRDGLEFEKERIERFAVTRKNERGFLLDIIEKPGPEEIEKVKGKDGFIGVSMNIFRLDYNMVFPFLENSEFHPIRNEKELPLAVKNMADVNPDSVYAFQVSEHVPDLTSKRDIIPVKKYLETHFNNLVF